MWKESLLLVRWQSAWRTEGFLLCKLQKFCDLIPLYCMMMGSFKPFDWSRKYESCWDVVHSLLKCTNVLLPNCEVLQRHKASGCFFWKMEYTANSFLLSVITVFYKTFFLLILFIDLCALCLFKGLCFDMQTLHYALSSLLKKGRLLYLWWAGLLAPQHVRIYLQTRIKSKSPALEGGILNHWTTKKPFDFNSHCFWFLQTVICILQQNFQDISSPLFASLFYSFNRMFIRLCHMLF